MAKVTVKYEVPLVGQRQSMSCWYASACMICYFREAGPRLGLPDKWIENKGVTPTDFVALAKNEGFKPIKLPIAKWSSANIYAVLRQAGPLWCAGYWFGPGHIIVLTGIEDDKIYLNDPDGPQKKTGTVDWFNMKLAWNVKDPVMYKPV